MSTSPTNVVVITGASSGIVKAPRSFLAKRELILLVSRRSEPDRWQLFKYTRPAAARPLVCTDVTNRAEVEASHPSLVDGFGFVLMCSSKDARYNALAPMGPQCDGTVNIVNTKDFL